MTRKLPIALALALISTPVLAAEDPGAPTPTAPASPSVAEQIDAFIRSSPATDLPHEGQPLGVTSSAGPREPHGMVSVGVGTHGYRSVYMRSDLPLGETGTLSVAIGDVRDNGGGFGAWPHGGFGPGRCRGAAGAPDTIAPRWPSESVTCGVAGR